MSTCTIYPYIRKYIGNITTTKSGFLGDVSIQYALYVHTTDMYCKFKTLNWENVNSTYTTNNEQNSRFVIKYNENINRFVYDKLNGIDSAAR